MKIKENSIYYNELFFAIYLFLFILLRVFTTTFQSVSSLILLLAVGLLFMSSYIFNKGKIPKQFIIILLISILFWVTQIIFFFNDYTFHYLYYFIIYGLLTLYFYSQIRYINIFLNYYSILAMISFFILLLDPISGFRFSATYMTFGTALLPAFCGLIVGWFYLKKYYYSIFALISMVLLLFFANRSAILTAGFFVIAASFYCYRPRKRQYKKKFVTGMILLSLFLISILIILNLNPILVFLNNNYIVPNGFESYSLNTLIRFTENWDFLAEYSSRGAIQEEALNYISNNNFIIGNGVGSFHSYFGNFSHNFLIDIMNQFGVIGTIVFLIFFINSIRKFIASFDEVGLFFILFFCISIIPLSFSSTYIETSEFWVILMYGIFNDNYRTDQNILKID